MENATPAKVNTVNSSSLIDLKAELFRKQEEFKAQKLQSQNLGFVKGKLSTSNKKPSVFSKKNVGVTQRAEKDYEEKMEEEDVFERSKKALENKARLYEKITSGVEIPEEDGSGLYLVDFQKKVIDDVLEKREKQRREKDEQERREAEEERRMLQEPVPAALNEDDEWVDFVDSFGRSRRCLRKDLPDIKQKDTASQDKKRENSETTPSLLSADMRRELERQKWENEEEETMQAEKEGPIHYADVRHNETRTHGVGFYQFDKDEEVRQEQMDELLKMREQTKDERSKRDRIKDKRKAALAARLAKVKQRKKEKMGLTGQDSEDEKGDSDEEIGPKMSEVVKTNVEPEPLTRDDTWRQSATSTREWDKGKERIMERSEQVWLEKQRAEREEEFAPPSFYFDAGQNSKKGFTNKSKKQNDKQKSLYKKSDQSNLKSGNSITCNSERESGQNMSENSSNSSGIQDVIQRQLHKLRDEVSSGNTYTEQMSFQEGLNVSCANTSVPITPLLFSTPPPPPPTTPPTSSCASMTTRNNAAHYTSNDPSAHFSVFTQNAHQSYSHYIPPPNVNIPPPVFNAFQSSYNLPPPSVSAHMPNVNIPPPNVTPVVPMPNVNIPPPNVTPVVPMSYVHVSTSSPASEFSAQTSTPSMNSELSANQTCQNANTESSQTSVPSKTKFVDKMSVIDTRLMQNEDD